MIWSSHVNHCATTSAPMLIIGLVVGILVSLLQAVTQIRSRRFHHSQNRGDAGSGHPPDAPDGQAADGSRGEMFTNGLMN